MARILFFAQKDSPGLAELVEQLQVLNHDVLVVMASEGSNLSCKLTLPFRSGFSFRGFQSLVYFQPDVSIAVQGPRSKCRLSTLFQETIFLSLPFGKKILFFESEPSFLTPRQLWLMRCGDGVIGPSRRFLLRLKRFGFLGHLKFDIFSFTSQRSDLTWNELNRKISGLLHVR